MKTLNGAGKHAGKKVRTAQLRKTTESQSEQSAPKSPESPGGKNPDPTLLDRRGIHSLLGLLPAQKMEDAAQRVGAVLELLRCKLIADADVFMHPSSMHYDEIETQKVCGILDMIMDAQKAFADAYTASDTLVKEVHQLAGMPA